VVNDDPAVRQVNQIQEYAQLEQNPVNRQVLAGIKTLRDQGPRQSIRYLDGEHAAVLLVAAFGGNFPDFLKETFAGLRSKGTKNLIIDLRGCTGGSAPFVGLLFSYLTSNEFRQVERVYAKTYAPSFRQYTPVAEVDPVTDSYWSRWKPDPNGGWLKTEGFPIIRVRQPSENHFDGPVYILIDGGTISAGSMFAAIADFHKRATFIGEETGGAAQGGAGVGAVYEELSPTLPASHLNLGIPGEAYFTVADPNNRSRGTLPTHTVRQTVEDLAKGRDTVLEFTRELIRRGN
jgi:C-terminal processing protease CtpA/Prc